MGGGERERGGSKTQWREGRERGSDMGREETGAAIYFPLLPTDTAHESGEPSAFFPPFFSPHLCVTAFAFLILGCGRRRGANRRSGEVEGGN